jgi:hypothetical protein
LDKIQEYKINCLQIINKMPIIDTGDKEKLRTKGQKEPGETFGLNFIRPDVFHNSYKSTTVLV